MSTVPAEAATERVPPSLLTVFKKAANKWDMSPLALAAVFSCGEHACNYPVKGPWASSYAGASGPWQFMPGTWPKYAQDCNGDGRSDVQNLHDASCAAAQYLSQAGLRGQYGIRGGALTKTLRHLREAASIYNSGCRYAEENRSKGGSCARSAPNGVKFATSGDYATQTKPYVMRVAERYVDLVTFYSSKRLPAAIEERTSVQPARRTSVQPGRTIATVKPQSTIDPPTITLDRAGAPTDAILLVGAVISLWFFWPRLRERRNV